MQIWQHFNSYSFKLKIDVHKVPIYSAWDIQATQMRSWHVSS